jgi:hypothetical protein
LGLKGLVVVIVVVYFQQHFNYIFSNISAATKHYFEQHFSSNLTIFAATFQQQFNYICSNISAAIKLYFDNILTPYFSNT